MSLERGALANIIWRDEPGNEETVYISFGNFDEKTGLDSFGVDDEDIFYYSTPEEIENLGEGRDFRVVHWEGVKA